MAGANYMGGKRNNARAKSKDVVGRAQRRHFGKQRLASALYATQENRVRPSAPSLSSILPEITLAHARCNVNTDCSAPSVRRVFGGDRLYLSTLPSDMPRHNKPSKVLGVLDTSNHTSMRAAINRILQQPSLVGINILNHKDTAYSEHMQTLAVVRPPTDAHPDSKDVDTHPEIVSKHVFHPRLSYSPISKHRTTNPRGNNPSTPYGSTKHSSLSLSNSPLGICHVASRDAFDDTEHAEMQMFSEANLFLCAEDDEIERPNVSVDAIHTLPRSSPFPLSSQSSDNSILALDTSPCTAILAGRTGDLSEEDVDYVNASTLRSMRRPIFCQPSRSSPIHENSIGVDEGQLSISLLADFNEEKRKVERSWTIRCDDGRTFSLTGNNVFQHSPSSESERRSIQVSTSQEVTKDDGPNDISIDFLFDPHPWETIDRILELNPPDQSAAQTVEVNFTKGREGVGYVSPGRSGTYKARSSGVTSFEIRTDDEPSDDVRVTSSADRLITDPETSTVDSRMAIDTPDPPYTDNTVRPLFDTGPPFTRNEGNPHIPVRALQGAPSTSVIHCSQDGHARSSSPRAFAVRIAADNRDIDMTFDGPCLFGDSDLEEGW